MTAKPKLLEVEGAELDAILADKGDLSRPYIYSSRVDNRIHFFANADELRAWRALQNTSASEQK